MRLEVSDPDEVSVFAINLGALFEDVEVGASEVDDCLDSGSCILDIHAEVVILELDILRLHDKAVSLAASLAEHCADCVVCQS